MPATSLPPALFARLDELSKQLDEMDAKMGDPDFVTDHKAVRELSIKKAAIEGMVGDYRTYKSLVKEAEELRGVLGGRGGPADNDFIELARAELPEVEARAEALIDRIKSALVNADDRAVGSVMLEIRAGTGGDEACLWARDLMEMYQKYAGKKGWTFEVLELTPEPGVGGIRAAVINVRGEGVWSELAFEAGVHSVKRVPATEAQGRIHTSTATVATLPEPEEVQVKIDWANDVYEDVTTSQGPGGQNVNKVATAVKLVHKPTGIEVKMQESKSQQQNRAAGRRLLMARVYELELRKAHEARSSARRDQIGSGERSEKIRTYRFKDGIVADERLPGEYPVRDIVAGDMGKLFKDLMEQETTRRLGEL
jgi:peptide chain release factor 1